ncbi:DUF6299 family protein [Streptomyces botrytidirepellens]|uniref:DUF6299 domain-containing protein n=1 Tax=Streptomyces botrytidirepellens TaxID=2486417 RepID=A0A3M8XBW5_9ACTN|nr:DUF6299 family protein [Streptomyces botrytidirepellens]RNG38441.1 hypothetical protein EEJ42_00940 [Streptomyces botrytidirepellens]
MRNRRRFLGAVTGLLIAAPLIPAAHAAPAPAPAPAPGSAAPAGVPGMPSMGRQSLPLPWGNNVTVNRIGYVSSNGTVALSGTYRCLRDGADIPRADILVTLTQGQVRYGLGGSPALCDGVTHTWSVQDGAGVRFVPGPALVESSLLRFEAVQQFVPLPRTAAVRERAITLEAREL